MSATLSFEDAALFFKLYWGLLYHANLRWNLVKGLQEPVFERKHLEQVAELQKRLCKTPDLFESFVAVNPFGYSKEELDIVRGWKQGIEGEFVVVAHEKERSIFMPLKGMERAYGVTGQMTPISELIPFVPIICWTVLLPFKGRIVTCSVVGSEAIHFGGSLRKSLNESYKRAKSRYGIITSLDEPAKENPDADEELLAFYVGTAERREEHEEDIARLLKKEPELVPAYHRLLGRANGRAIHAKLRASGASGWFAVLDDTVVSSGRMRAEAEAAAQALLPEEKRSWLHLLRVK